MIYYAPVTDYIPKSTYSDNDIFNFTPGGGATYYLNGLRINSVGEFGVCYIPIRDVEYTLLNINVIAYLISGNPQNVSLLLSAGAMGEAWNTHVVSTNPYSLNPAAGTGVYFVFDVYPELTAITNNDNVQLVIGYSSTATVSNLNLICVQVNYDLT